MENKNFEKIELKPVGGMYNTYARGYNTCLDRTNAKGIYEALKKLYDAIGSCIDLTPELLQEVQTELKKAEQ